MRDSVGYSEATPGNSLFFLIMNDITIFGLGRHRISRSRIGYKGAAISVGRAISDV